MSPAMQMALKKALVAALAAGVAVFFREFTKEQERLDREAARSGSQGATPALATDGRG